jgi:hypothetical protein
MTVGSLRPILVPHTGGFVIGGTIFVILARAYRLGQAFLRRVSGDPYFRELCPRRAAGDRRGGDSP